MEKQVLHKVHALCPHCLEQLPADVYADEDGKVWMTRTCPEHGEYVVRIRFEHDTDGSLKVCRLVYDQSSTLAANFDTEIEKKPRRKPRHRRKHSHTIS